MNLFSWNPFRWNPLSCRNGAATLALAAPLLTLLTWQAFAEAPVIAIETKLIDITVEVDPAFKTYPGLVDNCSAEGKRFAAQTLADAEDQRHNDPASFRDGVKWSADRAYTLRSAIGYYVSIVRTDDSFEGGAHPNHLVDTILWDAGAQKRISIRSFFKETADNGPTMTALAQQARLAVAAEKIARAIPAGDADTLQPGITLQDYLRKDTFIADGIKPTLLGLGPVTLAPSGVPDKSAGLTFHYSPYGVGPYVEGAYTVFVPYTAFSTYLSDLGKQLFAGTRPKSDDKD